MWNNLWVKYGSSTAKSFVNLFKPSVRDGIFRVLTPADPRAKSHRTFTLNVKARLHRRFLSRHLDAIFVALKLQQVSNMFETPAISRRQIALKIAPGLHVRFRSCNFGSTKIASSCRDKNRLIKRALIKQHKTSVHRAWKWNSRKSKSPCLVPILRSKTLE